MKIIHVFNELKFSGAEIMYVDAAPLFTEKGCELTALATSINLGEFAPYFKNANYRILHRPCPGRRNLVNRLKFFRSFVKLLKKEKYDVVHIHRSDVMWGCSLCTWLASKTAVYTFHSIFSSRKLSYPYHWFLRWSAKYIFKCRFQTISDSVYENELKYYYNQTAKIYNWYSSTRFYPALTGEKAKVRAELKIPANALVLISVGGCSSIKRHTEIIRALPEVLQKHDNTLYLHLGTGCSEKDELTLAKELGVLDNIRFCGNRSEVREYLIASDLYIMTSKFEGISLTTIEALACCIPAILYNVPGLRDFNSTQENCILIPENWQTIAEKIIFLEEHPEKRINLYKRAKAFVDSTFSMEKNADLIYRLYQ